MALPIPKDINGCALLAAYALKYSHYLPPEGISNFLKAVAGKI